MRDGPLLIDRTTDDQNGIDTLRLKGPLTLSTVFQFQEAIRADPKAKTIVELSGVVYMDSAGLGSILSFHAACKRSDRRYALVGLTPRVYTMFFASKVDKLVHIVPTIKDAEQLLSS
jgi:anti-sigma B factor antagonist